MTDQLLLREMQQGQQEALEKLMDKYRRYVFTVVTGILGDAGNPADAEELTQDAFYSVWEHADPIRPGRLKAYLLVREIRSAGAGRPRRGRSPVRR